MAAKSIDLANYNIDPIARYKSMGTHDLIPQDIWEFDRLAADFQASSELSRADKALYGGWIHTEIAEVHERSGQNVKALTQLVTANKSFLRVAKVDKPRVFDRLSLNRTMDLVELRKDIVAARNNRLPVSYTPTQQKLGSLAAAAYSLCPKLKGEAQRLTRGIATEILFASLLLDSQPNEDLLFPAPASPRLEHPLYGGTRAVGKHLNKARDFTVLRYDKRGYEIGRKPVQVKTSYGKKTESEYCESVAVITRRTHLHIDNDDEALNMAIALEKPAFARTSRMQHMIRIARQNIADELKLK